MVWGGIPWGGEGSASAALDAVLQHTPHTITVGEATKPCLLRELHEEQEVPGRGLIVVPTVQVTVRHADFPALKKGDTCTVDGVSYRVQSPPLRGGARGAALDLRLEKVVPADA